MKAGRLIRAKGRPHNSSHRRSEASTRTHHQVIQPTQVGRAGEHEDVLAWRPCLGVVGGSSTRSRGHPLKSPLPSLAYVAAARSGFLARRKPEETRPHPTSLQPDYIHVLIRGVIHAPAAASLVENPQWKGLKHTGCTVVEDGVDCGPRKAGPAAAWADLRSVGKM